MSDSPINVGGTGKAKILVQLLSQLPDRPGGLWAAEVGVYRGACAAYLLAHVPKLTLVLVDPWAEIAEDSAYRKTGDRCAALTQAQHEENYQAMLAAVAPYQTGDALNRAIIERQSSLAAAAEQSDGFLDMVFIDGAHDYASVAADIAAWWPKVRPGGLLTGHDYKRRGYKNDVVRAVDEFVAQVGLPLVPHGCLVWEVKKPEGRFADKPEPAA